MRQPRAYVTGGMVGGLVGLLLSLAVPWSGWTAGTVPLSAAATLGMTFAGAGLGRRLAPTEHAQAAGYVAAKFAITSALAAIPLIVFKAIVEFLAETPAAASGSLDPPWPPVVFVLYGAVLELFTMGVFTVIAAGAILVAALPASLLWAAVVRRVLSVAPTAGPRT